MAVQLMPVDPDAGISDLIRRLTDDSKRLVAGEVHLAKLELRDSVQRTGRGAMLLGVGFAMTVVATVMVTLLLATLVGRFAAGHMWIGALLTGAIEVVVGAWMVTHGLTIARTSVEEARSS